MPSLTQERCVACNRDAPRLSDEVLRELQPQIPDWTVIQREDIPRLERTYRTADFLSALDLTHRIGQLAEQEGHHPAILTEWGRVTVTWWTHKIRGLHRNDVVMAAKTDQIAEHGS
ncbi:MAG: 4a-hydroxytetrahydrobiopterin dehydratase [Chloroflexota bacterium]|nr:4a-hydroxytetrahydrobiopterin dehydratase [Chloroflexota bacterium]